MKTIKNIILFCFLSCFVFLAYAKQEKVIQIFRNGEIIQEYPASEIDYIEVNDLILPPNEINATIQNNQIVIEWESVEDATYNVYRSRDNATYILLAYNLTETRYTDTDPFPDTNYYRITAVIDGNESNESETVTVVTPTIELPSGVYLGIYGFSRGFQIQPIQNITDENISHYNTFIDGLSATQAFTWLYYAVDKSIDYLQSTSFPEDLSEVAIVTFTDGQDVGSLDKIDEEENGKYLTPTQYRQALHSRLISEEVSNINISAFTIGVLEGKQGASLNTFRNNMNSLATSTSNVYEVEKMESLNQAFEQIANSLSETKYVQKFILSISGLGEGDLCRFTFDNVNSYQNSKLYIEGTYRRRDKALTNIKYVGLTSTSGSEVVGVFDDESGKYNYTFEGLKADDGSLIPTTKVQHWFTDDGTWQDVDDEFFFNPDDATLEKIKRSAAIMLNLDCSSSMQGQKLITLQEAAKKFIQILVDNTVDPYEVSEVQLDKSNLILQIGETATLKATVLPTTAKLKSVTWTSSNPNVADVNENGEVSAKSVGTSVITVTTIDGGHTANCEINVIIPVSDISFNTTSLEMKVGDSYELQSEVFPSNASIKQLQWVSSNPEIVSVSMNGMINALSGGTAVVSATALDGTNKSNSCTVYVNEAGVIGYNNGHEYIDLGLPSGIKWSSQYMDNEFAWGEIVTKNEFNNSNSLTRNVTLTDFSGNPTYDAARYNWGGSWRIPTKQDFDELISECIWEKVWLTGAGVGVDAFKVTGPNGRYIYLSIGKSGTSIIYLWTSTPYPSNEELAYCCRLGGSKNLFELDYAYRAHGLMIRPICDE